VHVPDGRVERHTLYAEKAVGDRFMASIFPLHSGRYFGIVGVTLFMVASLAMPLFAITGWMLYLARRRQKKGDRIRVPGESGLAAEPTGSGVVLETET
jgi:sulfite reductase (NADPH) flavoprotein alpha-component